MIRTYPAHIIRAAQVCQASDDIRTYLNGVHFTASGEVVASDKHRLFRSPAGVEIPEAATVRLSKEVPNSADLVEIDFEKQTALPYRVLKSGQRRDLKMLSIAGVEGRFPDYERVIPVESTLTNSVIHLSSAYLDGVSVFASADFYGGVKIRASEQSVVIEPMAAIWPKGTVMVIMQMRY